MNFDWRGQVILGKLAEGCTYQEAAEAAGITRQGLWLRSKASKAFKAAVIQARQQGQAERQYRLWLRHPFRGRRPPTGKGHGGRPKYTYARGA